MSSITFQEKVNKFWKSVEIRGDGECWEWKGYRNKDGYGQTGMGFGTRLANRVVWILTNGDIPEGSEVLHRCDNPPCCNPSHLFLGTQSDNMKDMLRKGRARNNTPSGEDHPRAKLREKDVLEILGLCKQGISHKTISQKFNIGLSTVSMITSGRSWSYLRKK